MEGRGSIGWMHCKNLLYGPRDVIIWAPIGYVSDHRDIYSRAVMRGPRRDKSRLMGRWTKAWRHGPQSIVKFEVFLSALSLASFRIRTQLNTLLLTENAKVYACVINTETFGTMVQRGFGGHFLLWVIRPESAKAGV
ncbi:hypothetical protein QQP08_008878 [Theobroma cacao]|nr:hypothetical protein QQP08_008878 [Theobroma cacao]